MRMALEQRLNVQSRERGIDIIRLRRHVAFDRFLARLFSAPIPGLVTKGGYVLELRAQTGQARLTKDIDFSFTGNLDGAWSGSPDGLQGFLQRKAALDLGDFFTFAVNKATLDLENAPYGGFRYPIEAEMAGRKFISFRVDIAAGDAWSAPHDTLQLHDWFDFAGIPPASIPVISMEQQFAEKLHSYTQVRDYPNSRVKDLVDMVLLMEAGMSKTRVLKSAKKTFSKRDAHGFPPVFGEPPESWARKYGALARSCGIEEDMARAVESVQEYCRSIGIAR
jgi:hypothetical protein